MSGAADAISGFDFGSVIDFAQDIGSVVTDFGTEFMSSLDISSFEIPSFDVANLGGFGEVGSFAGNASWFDTFNPGAILDNIPSISDFNISSLTSSLPSLSSIKEITSTVTGIAQTAQQGLATVQKFTPLVNAASSALGIPNPLTPITQAAQQVAGVAGAAAGIAGTATGALTGLSNLNTNNLVSSGAAALGINPSAVTSVNRLLNTNATDPYGLSILTDAESTALTKKATLINSLTDASLPSIKNYTQATESLSALTQSQKEITDSILGNDNVISAANKNIEEMTQNLLDPDLSATQRATLEAQIDANRATIAEATANNVANQESLNGIVGQLANDQQIIAQTNASAVAQPENVNTGPANDFTSAYDPETETWSVFNNTTGTTVSTGLSEQQAILAAEDLNITSGIGLNTSTTADEDPFEAARQAAIAESVNARSPTEADVLAAINGQTAALTNQARAQQSVRELRNNKAQSTDWRVRLKLAPNSSYLYNAGQPGILAALKATDGVIFPYTPSIETAYKANYDAYDLTHSNYRGYFYKSSHIDAVNIRGTFTAQDTKEADYLLAVIHFFRSCTKMFYGQDTQRGSPPPMVYLNGYGDYQFAEHPCVVSQFNYTLPPDVDYIRAQSTLSANTNQLNSRLRNTIANNPLSYSVNRLLNSKLLPGALDFRPTTPGSGNLATGTPTYVPTKMEISITLLPMQSRAQISNNFSVKEFANGNLLKGGYW